MFNFDSKTNHDEISTIILYVICLGIALFQCERSTDF